MNSIKIIVLAFAFLVSCTVVSAPFSASHDTTASVRNFEFTYLTKIPSFPEGGKNLRVWIPLPHSEPYLSIGDLKIESSLPYEKHHDQEYGNEYLYLQILRPQMNAEVELRLNFQVTRHEHRVALDPHPLSTQSPRLDWTTLQRFLQPGSPSASSGNHCRTLGTRDLRNSGAARESESDLQLRHRHHALRQVRHRLGQRRCDMGLHR